MAKNVTCRDCTTSMPRTAKFCPRCGRASDSMQRTAAAPVVNLATVKAPIPKLGLLFLVAMLLGPALALIGLYVGSLTLLWCGAGLIGIVLVLMLLGIFM